MLTVSKISKSTSVTADTIRHYVRIGLLNPKRNQRNGYKLFKVDDINRVKFISQAKHLGFSLNDISKILNHSHNGESPCPAVREIIQHRIEENKIKLVELVKLQHRMEEALQKWKEMPDGEPDGRAICHLIESV